MKVSVLISMFLIISALKCFADNVKIGNFYYSAPNGIAFIKDDAAAFVIDPILGENKYKAVFFDDAGGFAQAHFANPYNAGIVAPDDSYHRVVFELSNNEIVEMEWSKIGNAAVGRLVCSRPEIIEFDLSKNWPGWYNDFIISENILKGSAISNNTTVNWSMKWSTSNITLDGKTLKVKIGDGFSPTYFSAGFTQLPPLSEVNDIIDKAYISYEQNRPKATGGIGDFVGAMTSNLNNTRLYCNDHHMTFIPVSRIFGMENANQAPVFCWDSFFNALMSCYDNPEMSRETLNAVFKFQLDNGMIGNVAHWSMGPSTGNSQPPVGSMCVWKIHLMRPDINYLKQVYPKLKKWNEWWLTHRNPCGDGLLSWGDDYGNWQIALYETGWDDTPHYSGVNGIKMNGTTMNCYSVDLCSLWAMDAHYLSLIAEAIGDKEAAAKHQKDCDEMNKRINDKLWNEELGIYCSRFFDNPDGTPGEFLTKLAPLNFYPLLSGAASKRQAALMESVMLNPELFWGEWIIPTIARNTPEYHRQRYWSGNIWGPANYLIWLGIKRYFSKETIIEFARKSVNLFMHNWIGQGYCGETFLPKNGRVCNNPNYTWGALLCLIGIESIIDIDDYGNIVKGQGFGSPVHLNNITLNGKLYNVSIEYNKPIIKIEKQHHK